MRSRPEAGSTDQDWGEKRAQNMVTVENDGAKQAVFRSVDEIFNARRATRKISHPSHSVSVPYFIILMIKYGTKAWTVTRREEGLLERTEMRMLWWIRGVSLEG